MQVGSKEVLSQPVQLVAVPEAWPNWQEAARSLMKWTGVHVSSCPALQNGYDSSHSQLAPDPDPGETQMAWP